MYAASYRNTERGIAARQSIVVREQPQVERVEPVQAPVSLAERIAAMRIIAAERRQAEFESARAVLRDRSSTRFARIQARAVVIFGVSYSELRGNSRAKRIAFARQFVAYWTCRLTDFSLPQIGRLIGGRDHTTILHGKRSYVAKRAAMGRFLREAR